MKGINNIWFIGDEFCDCSYTQHYKFVKNNESNRDKWYIPEYYEMHEFSSTCYSSSLRNILARFKGLLIHAITKEKVLPKAIVFILDEDIIMQSKIPMHEAEAGEYALVVKYLLQEVHRILTSYLELLPNKSKWPFLPQVIWMSPPQHTYFANNKLRLHFTTALDQEVQAFPNMCSLSLKKV